jgi:hypothetical protein
MVDKSAFNIKKLKNIMNFVMKKVFCFKKSPTITSPINTIPIGKRIAFVTELL